MGDLFDGLLAVVSGGATGLLGVIAQRLFDHWKLKQEIDKLRVQHEHEQSMRRIDAEIMAQEWAARTKVAEVEAAGKEAVADAQAFASSFGLEPKLYSEKVKPGKWGGFLLILADVVRAVIRPGLTVYLAWVAHLLYEQNRALIAVIDPSTDTMTMFGLHKQIVLTLLYLFTTCVLWWFGTRNKASQPKFG